MAKKKKSTFQKITQVVVWIMLIVTILGLLLSVLVNFINF